MREPRGVSWHYPIDQLHSVGGAIGFGRTQYFISNGRNTFLVQDEPGFGARTVVGLNYEIPKSPVELMVELAPAIAFAPAGDIDFDAGLGARYYF